MLSIEKTLNLNFNMEYRILRRLTESKFHNEDLLEYDQATSSHNRYSNILPFK